MTHEFPPAWPTSQAQALADHLALKGKTHALFETGYGPSGLPHIGTFGEVARTTWVRRAFENLSQLPTKLIAFSDDMDALRKLPDNVPNHAELQTYLGRSLSKIPDPWQTHGSYAEHNNAQLQKFLHEYEFDHEFISSTHAYETGMFDAGLLRMAHLHEQICDVIRPTLQADRRSTYSCFLPVHPVTGEVMQVSMKEVRPEQNELVWMDPHTGETHVTSIRGGACKAQWKADWALRWYVLDVDYEMHGKDLIDSVTISKKIVKILGGVPPLTMMYELFLDERGEKISKSKGNGVSMAQWLRYAPPDSLCQFMFPNPQRSRKIFVQQIPSTVDEYFANVQKHQLAPSPNNPVAHIHGDVPAWSPPLSYQMLLNLVSVLGTSDVSMVWEFLQSYLPDVNAQEHPQLHELIQMVICYHEDHVLPLRVFKMPNAWETQALQDLREVLTHMDHASSAEQIQFEVFEVGKRHPFPNLRLWFALLYECLLGRPEGPRFGHFVHMYGVQRTVQLIDDKLSMVT
jgi:lysyl-tRNA synthetase class 1